MTKCFHRGQHLILTQLAVISHAPRQRHLAPELLKRLADKDLKLLSICQLEDIPRALRQRFVLFLSYLLGLLPEPLVYLFLRHLQAIAYLNPLPA